MKIALEILQYVGPFIGVLIGWYLSQKSEKRKIQYDEKKKVKHTLFLLLEIRTELTNLSKDDKIYRLFIDRLKEKFNVAEPTEEESAIVKGLMSKLNKTMSLDKSSETLENQFISCVKNLSEINPLLAFKINGKQFMREVLENWEHESRQALSLEDFNQTELMLQQFKPKMIKELENNLNDIILSVAKLTEDKQIIKETSELIQEKLDAEYNAEVTELVDIMFDIDRV